MKTELIVLLIVAIVLSTFGIYKQRSIVRSIGSVEFRWQTRASKIRFFIMMIIYVVVYPPSKCDSCQRRISPRDLIPVFSYIWLRGRCRYCHARIPSPYLAR